MPKKIRDWSLRTLQVKLIKIGAKVVKHSRYVIFQMAEVMVLQLVFVIFMLPETKGISLENIQKTLGIE